MMQDIQVDAFDENTRITPRFVRLDAANARDFRDACLGLQLTTTRVVLDLSHVKFIDSTGLGALVAIKRQLGSNPGSGSDVVVVVPDPSVRTIFEITRIDKAIRVTPSYEEATA